MTEVDDVVRDGRRQVRKVFEINHVLDHRPQQRQGDPRLLCLHQLQDRPKDFVVLAKRTSPDDIAQGTREVESLADLSYIIASGLMKTGALLVEDLVENPLNLL